MRNPDKVQVPIYIDATMKAELVKACGERMAQTGMTLSLSNYITGLCFPVLLKAVKEQRK